MSLPGQDRFAEIAGGWDEVVQPGRSCCWIAICGYGPRAQNTCRSRFASRRSCGETSCSRSNAPLLDHGELLGVVQHVEPVTQVQHAVATLGRALEDGASWSVSELLHVLSAVSATENAHHCEERHALLCQAEQLHSAIESRDTIGQAKGTLMERYDIDAAAAFDRLVKISQETNTPVVQVARELIRSDRTGRR